MGSHRGRSRSCGSSGTRPPNAARGRPCGRSASASACPASAPSLTGSAASKHSAAQPHRSPLAFLPARHLAARLRLGVHDGHLPPQRRHALDQRRVPDDRTHRRPGDGVGPRPCTTHCAGAARSRLRPDDRKPPEEACPARPAWTAVRAGWGLRPRVAGQGAGRLLPAGDRKCDRRCEPPSAMTVSATGTCTVKAGARHIRRALGTAGPWALRSAVMGAWLGRGIS